MDKRAVEILFSSYWSPKGWKPERDRGATAEDFNYAKGRGVMFDPVYLAHDQVMEKALLERDAVNARAIADAFVFSLGTRALAYRSALGSYAILQHFPRHTWSGNERHCRFCGGYHRTEASSFDLSILNFERLKWGGVRHIHPHYAAFDLNWFRHLEHVVPTPEHVTLLKSLLQAIEQAPAGTTSATLECVLPKSLKSNKAERDVLIGILGFAGVLETGKHPGFFSKYIPEISREFPDRRFVDMAYPACWWKREDGLNRQAVHHWFGHLL